MRTSFILPLAVLLVMAPAVPARGQGSGTMVSDLMSDVTEVEQKLVSLARAMPAEKWSWRPGTGVRSVGEVFQHVAADNYLLPAFAGTPASNGSQ